MYTIHWTSLPRTGELKIGLSVSLSTVYICKKVVLSPISIGKFIDIAIVTDMDIDFLSSYSHEK